MEVSVSEDALIVDGQDMSPEMEYTPSDPVVEANCDGELLIVKVKRTRTGFDLTTRGATHKLRVLPDHVARHAVHMIEKLPPDTSKLLLCPMPGLLIGLHVAVGDVVQPGQPLATVEAMKMENILRAEKAATVTKINAGVGDSLAVDAVILELE